MTVIQTSGGQIKPGRYADFLAQAAEASKLFQRLGTTAPRLHVAGFAGEAWGTWTFSVEYDDWDSFGRVNDAFNNDGEAQTFMLRVQEADTPSLMQQVQLLTEIPLREPKGGRGPVMAVWVSKAHPGGLEGTLDMANRSNAFAETQGAVNARLYNTIGAGSGTGLYVCVWEFEDFRGYARVIEAFSTEPEGQAIATAAAAADAPDTLVFEGVYNEIPI